MPYTLKNILKESKIDNPVKRSKVIGERGIYKLLQPIWITLSSGRKILIPNNFTWDLASVPQIVHNIIRPSGDDDIA